MTLKLVPKFEPDGKSKIITRIKQVRREDGVLCCNRCGCNVSLTTVAGALIQNGRKQGGKVLEKDVCAECYKRGIYSPMLPELKPVK